MTANVTVGYKYDTFEFVYAIVESVYLRLIFHRILRCFNGLEYILGKDLDEESNPIMVHYKLR